MLVSDRWTRAELVRGLKDIQADIGRLNDRIDSKMVQREYYDSQHADLLGRVNKIEAEREQDKNWKRNVSLTLMAAAIGAVGSLSGLIGVIASGH